MNPMAVELAKLALWLETVSSSQPLTFLDHHLRCGNSLVGARIEALGVLPGAPPLQENMVAQQVKERLPDLLKPLSEIRAIPSDTPEQVKAKEKLYRRQFDKVRQPILNVADLWCSTFFTDAEHQPTAEQYRFAVETLAALVKAQKYSNQTWFSAALDVARRPDVAAFHWELEFPEAFFGDAGRSSDGGFNAIIGNPPYDVLSEKETGHDLSAFRTFIEAESSYAATRRGKNNLYKLFICRALHLLAEGGRLGFIAPMAILGDDQARQIRKLILEPGFKDYDASIPALAKKLRSFAAFNGCEQVIVEETAPRKVKAPLKRALS